MSAFVIEDGGCGRGRGSYEAGLLTLPDGATRGVETITRLTVGDREAPRSGASRAVPDFLGSLRSVLPAVGTLSMPARLAVSTVRAGLGVIEEGFAPDASGPVPVEIGFDDEVVVARMEAGLLAAIRRDREIALGVLARASRGTTDPVETMPEAEEVSEALTSIFRYEKRNGRLRRIAEPEPSSKD